MLPGLLFFFLSSERDGERNILELTMQNSCPQTLKKEGYSEKKYESKNNTKQM